jgi:hypothetical protein
MRKKKTKKDLQLLPFNSDDFNWCVSNDWQIYIMPLPRNAARIVLRKYGITTKGKDSFYDKDTGINHISREVFLEDTVKFKGITFRSYTDASNYIPLVYKTLRDEYS